MFVQLSTTGNILGYIIEGCGIAVIAIGFVYAAIHTLIRFKSSKEKNKILIGFRHDVKKTMLLGLDFLVAGDIIRTVTVEYSLSGLASLGLLVLIRTILVFTIHLELEGHWPWQQARNDGKE